MKILFNIVDEYRSFPLDIFCEKVKLHQEEIETRYAHLNSISLKRYLQLVDWADYIFIQKPYFMCFIPKYIAVDHEFACKIETDVIKTNKICLIPYGSYVLNVFDDGLVLNMKYVFTNYKYRKAENIIEVGNLTSEKFREYKKTNCKLFETSKKHVIYAPHHAFEMSKFGIHSNFLRYHDKMIDLFKRYSDKIEFIIKPHPEIRRIHDLDMSEFKRIGLKVHEDYDYIQLFEESDAMIHDCISFNAEYMHVGKPQCFMFNTDNEALLRTNLTDIGKLTFDLNYQASEFDEIEKFIEDVVLNGNDVKKEEREKAVDEKLFNWKDGKEPSTLIIDFLKKRV